MGTKTLAVAAATAAGLWATASQADIAIALAGPLSGPAATYGEQTRAGVEAAVADINAKGGINGEKLVLTVEDDACDGKQAVAVANKLVNRKVVAVIGHVCSGAAVAAADVYADEGILMVTPTATTPQLTESGLKNVFRVCGRDDQQGVVAARAILDRFKGRKVAILHDKQAYGKGLADAVKAELNKAGVQEALYASVNAGERDYTPVVTRLKSEGIDVVYYGGYETEFGLIVRQAAELKFAPQFIGADGLNGQSYWNITGPAGEGTLFTFAPDPQGKPEAAAVVQSLKAKNVPVEGFTLFGYAATQAYAQAAAKAGGTKAEDVAAALRSGAFDTVVGRLEFDEKGDRKSPAYVMWTWKDGKTVELQ